MGKNAIDSSVVVKNIESKLKELKLSKAEFYRESGITSATLSNWRSETYAPSQEKLAAVAVYAVPAVLKNPRRVAPRRGYAKRGTSACPQSIRQGHRALKALYHKNVQKNRGRCMHHAP